jgi:secretion/DNA translocation related TadE-like protein
VSRGVRGLAGARGPARSRQRGSGTVLLVGVVGALLALTVGALWVVSAVVASHRAQSAADLAALAAAAVLVRGDSSALACERGTAIAALNGARLASCRAGPDLTVELVVDVPSTVSRVGIATARARAGPATSGAGP